jgi:hypothetical protein
MNPGDGNVEEINQIQSRLNNNDMHNSPKSSILKINPEQQDVRGENEQQISRKEIDDQRKMRLQNAKKKILTSPVVSSRSIYHQNCSSSKTSATSIQRKNKKKPKKSNSKIINKPKSRPLSYRNYSNNKVKNYSAKLHKYSKSRSPVNTYNVSRKKRSQPKRVKSPISTGRTKLPPRFGKNYYDKNPKFYVQMNEKIRKTIETPENEWNLDGPSFVSYMPSYQNQSSRNNFYDKKPTSYCEGHESDYKYTKGGIQKRSPSPNYKNKTMPDYFARAKYKQSPPFESVYSQSYNQRGPGYDMKCDQRPYYVKRYYKSPGRQSTSPANMSYRKRSGSRSLSRKVKFDNYGKGLDKEVHTVRKVTKEPKLHPLQFCNFCDNYFHEKCFKEYYQKKDKK